MRARVARCGRKHRIGVAHILAALMNAGEPIVEGTKYWYYGPDDRGVELEIIAVPDDTGRADVTVIHVMPTLYRR
jgi:hypothetical protein